MEFTFQCPQTEFYWNTAMLMCLPTRGAASMPRKQGEKVCQRPHVALHCFSLLFNTLYLSCDENLTVSQVTHVLSCTLMFC